MTIISFKERQERIAARAAERQAGELTDATFRASLFALGVRGDDIAMEARRCAPAPRYDHEEARYQKSIDWLREFLAR